MRRRGTHERREPRADTREVVDHRSADRSHLRRCVAAQRRDVTAQALHRRVHRDVPVPVRCNPLAVRRDALAVRCENRSKQ